jgi:hypothetical protein
MRPLSLPAQSLSNPSVPAPADAALPSIENPESKIGGGDNNLLLAPRDLTPTPADLRFVDVPAPLTSSESPNLNTTPLLKKEPKPKGSAVLRGIKDLQQLQKQTLAVLESVKGSLDEIAQVLRSPEATRGMEKQQNAAALLAKGFARDAVEQAQGAVALLPANPETHLLLALALVADQQFDPALAAARKGLALFDRRLHPLAIEAGLLHALAVLGCGTEAVDRWIAIIDALPLPILFDHIGRIASCFPAEVNGGGAALLDDLINRRLARDDQNPALLHTRQPRQTGPVHIRPDEIPPDTLFTGLDAARDFKLPNTHRAILGLVARRLQLVQPSAVTPANATDNSESPRGLEVIKFITECVIPLGNRGLERTADSLGRAAVRRLFRLHVDAATLHRAMGKLEMAGATKAVGEIRSTLKFWRTTANKVSRAKRSLILSTFLMLAGFAALAYVLFARGEWTNPGTAPKFLLATYALDSLWIGPVVMALGFLLGTATFLRRTWIVPLPEGRHPLTRHERTFLNSSEVRQSLQSR